MNELIERASATCLAVEVALNDAATRADVRIIWNVKPRYTRQSLDGGIVRHLLFTNFGVQLTDEKVIPQAVYGAVDHVDGHDLSDDEFDNLGRFVAAAGAEAIEWRP